MTVPIRFGMFDRGGEPADSQGGHSGWRAQMGGFVINDANGQGGGIEWSSFYHSNASGGSPPGSQAIGNGGTSGNGTDAIDAAFSAADAYNHANPTALQWKLKIRIFYGIYQPTWLKNLYGTVSNNNATLSPWWTTNYRNAFKAFHGVLAAYVPNYTVAATGLANTVPLALHPLLGEITCSSGPTYAEPMLLSSAVQGQPWTLAQLGATAQQLQTALYNALSDMLAIWTNTPISVSSNPCDYPLSTDANNTTFTIAYENSQVQAGGGGGVGSGPGPLTVLENNSLQAPGTSGPFTGNDPVEGTPWYTFVAGKPNYQDTHDSGALGSYSRMYVNICDYGQGAANSEIGSGSVPAVPTLITIQTSTLAKMGNNLQGLAYTLSYAISLGATCIELPSGYANVMTPAQMNDYQAGLVANLFNYNNPTPPSPAGGQFPAAMSGPGLFYPQ